MCDHSETLTWTKKMYGEECRMVFCIECSECIEWTYPKWMETTTLKTTLNSVLSDCLNAIGRPMADSIKGVRK